MDYAGGKTVAQSRTTFSPRSPKEPMTVLNIQQGIAPAPRLPSSAGALGSRRGQKCLVKPEGWDMTADTKKRCRWWIGLHTTAAACSWDLPSPGSARDALLLFRGWEELIKAQNKSLLVQVSLLCHLLQQHLMSSRKARVALQEAQELYKPESLKCQEEHPVGKHNFVEFTNRGWKLRSAGDLSRQGGTEHYRGAVNGNRKS